MSDEAIVFMIYTQLHSGPQERDGQRGRGAIK